MAITVLCIIIYIYLLNSYKFKAQNFYPAIIVWSVWTSAGFD